MTSRASALLIACIAGIIGLSTDELTADDNPVRGPRLIATQRIRSDAIGTLRPPAVSQDGRLVAFVARQTGSSSQSCCQNVYVLDRSTGQITQESIGADGTPRQGDSQAPSLSSDGRIIAFETVAANLPNTSHRSQLHVVVRDRQSRSMRTPVATGGVEPDGMTSEPAVSGDGRSIAFTSDATNLLPGADANGAQTDVYLWRLDHSTITRVSLDANGAQPPSGSSHSPSVSDAGELVAFVSTARLVAEDTNDVADVYLRDLRRAATRLVSRGVDGRAGNGPSHSPDLSADGRYVAFVSMADTLRPGDRNQDSDVYLYDVEARSTTLVSATARRHAANAGSRRPAISADGRFVVYQTLASNVGAGSGCPQLAPDPNLLPDVYLFDRATSCSTRISGSTERESWTPSVAPAIDGSGRLVAFSSTQPVSDQDLSSDFDLFFVERTIIDRHSPASRCCQ